MFRASRDETIDEFLDKTGLKFSDIQDAVKWLEANSNANVYEPLSLFQVEFLANCIDIGKELDDEYDGEATELFPDIAYDNAESIIPFQDYKRMILWVDMGFDLTESEDSGIDVNNENILNVAGGQLVQYGALLIEHLANRGELSNVNA
tara:strand:- start:310 stop:756 length:447 start_codon:yes stop_codon:yes gene_type:complete